MISILLVCCGLLWSPGPDEAAKKADLSAYQDARARVGRDADAQLRLALWCEAHGLSAERIKHLTLAILINPDNAAARGLLGLVSYQGKWQPPDEVVRQVQEDPARKALLAGVPAAAGPDARQGRRPVEAGPLVRGERAEGAGDGPSLPGAQARPGPRGRLEAAGLQEDGRALGQAGDPRGREGRARGAEPGQQVLEAPPGALAQRTGRPTIAPSGPRRTRPSARSPTLARSPWSGPCSPGATSRNSRPPSRSWVRSTPRAPRGRWRCLACSVPRRPFARRAPRSFAAAIPASSPGCWSP